MKSPFPGMDPYLERHWLDVHARFVTYAADQLNERLPRSLVARTEERVAIESEEYPEIRRAGPDVRVIQPGVSDVEASGISLTAPLKLVVDVEPLKEHFIQIVGIDDEEVVSVIEVLSPTNKIGKGLEQFRKTRAELIEGGIHLVEVDLVRRGDWRALLRPHICPRQSWTEYRSTVRLGSDRKAVYLYPGSIRAALPQVPVPLRTGDAEVLLELQGLVDGVYARGRYGETLDYHRTLDPPLSAEDEAWANQLLKAAGAR